MDDGEPKATIDTAHATALINARNVHCPACWGREFAVCDRLVMLSKYEPTTGVDSYYMQRNYPQLMIVCGRCDHTMLFDAQRLGLRDGGPQV